MCQVSVFSSPIQTIKPSKILTSLWVIGPLRFWLIEGQSTLASPTGGVLASEVVSDLVIPVSGCDNFVTGHSDQGLSR